MKSSICRIVCLVVTLVFSVQTVQAAFPLNSEIEHSAIVKSEKRSFDEFINTTIEKYKLPAPPVSDGSTNGSPALSITSLALAVSSLATIILAFELFAFLLLIPAAALGITAIILGAMGARRRPLRGVGMAGMILGIVDVSILLVVGFAALIFAGFTGQ